MQVGNRVTLKATKNSFCGMTGKSGPTEAVHNLIVTRRYVCGEHERISAENPDKPCSQVDAAVHAFEPA